MKLISDNEINRAVLSGPVWYPLPASSPTLCPLLPLPSSYSIPLYPIPPSPIPPSSPIIQLSSPTQLGSPLSAIEDDIFLEKEILPPLPVGKEIYIINTDFDLDLPDNFSPPISFRASHERKFEFTEEQRGLAANAVVPTSLADLKLKVRNDLLYFSNADYINHEFILSL